VCFNNPFADFVLLKSLARTFFATVSLFAIVSSPVRSQNHNAYSYGPEPEKIYLQLDGNIYTTDKTIWFKAIVTRAGDHTLTRLSGVLYVELISPEEKIIDRKLIKLDNGTGEGFFDLNQSYSEGLYLIRAYTEWDRNFGPDFFFKENIQVFAPSAKAKTDPISNIRLVEKQNNEKQLTAYFDPLAIDSLHKKELTVFITLDNKKDSLIVRKNDDDKYIIDYPIPDKSEFITMQMRTKNLLTFTKTIALNEDRPDLQFFPESGELVKGLPGKVGFKALDYNGKGKNVEGDIINGKGEVVTHFKSNRAGMGSFVLINVDTNSYYSASLNSQSDEKIAYVYPLPEVASRGNILSVVKKGNDILFTASSNYLKNDSIYIRTSCRGLVYYDIKGKLQEGLLRSVLCADSLPEGVIAFTMMDNIRQPVAERLYFNEKPAARITISVTPEKDTYLQRELTRLNIKTTDSKRQAVKASISLLALNKDEMGQMQSMRQNILSYFLLASDVRGEIENPGSYFNDTTITYNDLDVLLLTQGWRKYLYAKPVEQILFQPETSLAVSGTVAGILFQKKKSAELTLMTFGRHWDVQTQTTDSSGRFYFNISEEYGQNINVLIQSANRSGNAKNYTIELDKKTSPAISFNHIISIGKADSVIHKIVEKNVERKKVDDTYRLSGGILLGEVKVEAYRMTPARKKVMEAYGKPNQVINGESIQEKEEKWSFGLYSVLQSKFGDKISILRYEGMLLARVRNSEPTLIVVDGSAVNHEEYESIAYIPPSEVSSLEIIKNVSNRSKVWFEFCPECSPLSTPPIIDVIAIYTYGGNGIYGIHKPKGITKAVVPVFSTSKEFYAPKYENLTAADWYKPDLRALIHWEPMIKADSSGSASCSFYNGDLTGGVKVVVEAISEDGKIGYQEIIYNVRKREVKKE
jgi:hypothetical protein